ncbi:MAG: hypothetical protein GY705_21155 [Bacteroidetes bacterium]|nr:hypothetical protein [Bacteroidota bacterium]
MSYSEQNLPAFAQSWKFKHALTAKLNIEAANNIRALIIDDSPLPVIGGIVISSETNSPDYSQGHCQ